MSENAHAAVSVSEPTPEVVAHLLDLVAAHNVDHALSGIEDAIARLRADAEQLRALPDLLRAEGLPELTMNHPQIALKDRKSVV
mgnify:CR=1 FL=1